MNNMDDLGYYDRQGKRLTFGEYCELGGRMEQDGYKRVAESTVGPLWVSTVWIGLDMGFRFRGEKDYRPLIFETMVFPVEDRSKPPRRLGEPQDTSHLPAWTEEWLDLQWRYSTEAEALAGHEKVRKALSELLTTTTEGTQG